MIRWLAMLCVLAIGFDSQAASVTCEAHKPCTLRIDFRATIVPVAVITMREVGRSGLVIVMESCSGCDEPGPHVSYWWRHRVYGERFMYAYGGTATGGERINPQWIVSS